MESLYFAVMHFDEDRKEATFYTYMMKIVEMELLRLFKENLIERRFISLDQYFDDGTLYSELYGIEEEKIKNIILNGEIREVANKEEDENLEYISSKEERLHLLMMELTGQNDLSKNEKANKISIR